MTRMSILPLLDQAREGHFILPSFNVFNLETALAATAAAERLRSPVVLAVAEASFPYTDFEVLSGVLRELSDRAAVPVVLHLDHAETLDIVARAMRAGFTSFQFDGYGLPEAERVRQTRSVVDLAHSVGYGVEAELGHITKVGVDAEQRDESLGDPAYASKFVSATGVDIIAAAVGTVHGLQPGEASVEMRRLEEVVRSIPVHVSLHGGSGVNDEDLARIIDLGVTKISYYTGLSREAVRRARVFLDAQSEPTLHELMAEVRHGFESVPPSASSPSGRPVKRPNGRTGEMVVGARPARRGRRG